MKTVVALGGEGIGLGFATEAERLEAAVARVYRNGRHLTLDQGGRATKKEFGRAVQEALMAEA